MPPPSRWSRSPRRRAWSWRLVALGVLRPEVPPASQLAVGVAAGVSGAVGLVAFYRGLAIGAMSIVAPISALGALVPLVVDLVGGHVPGGLTLTGMVLALGGASLTASAPGPASRRGTGLAVVAALGFGGFFVLLAQAAADGPLWALVAARCGSVPLALVAAGAVGATLRPRAYPRCGWRSARACSTRAPT